jgi:hypothetical protein
MKFKYLNAYLPGKSTVKIHSCHTYRGFLVTACGRNGSKRRAQIDRDTGPDCSSCLRVIARRGRKWADY